MGARYSYVLTTILKNVLNRFPIFFPFESNRPSVFILLFNSGLIGRSWSMLFAAADYDVTLYDIDGKQLEGALAEIRKQLGELSKQGLLRGVLTAEQQFNNIKTTSIFEDCIRGASFIQVPFVLFMF